MASQHTCSRCRRLGALPVLWGYPSPEALEQARRGEVILGGCEIGEPMYRRLCEECATRLAKESQGELP